MSTQQKETKTAPAPTKITIPQEVILVPVQHEICHKCGNKAKHHCWLDSCKLPVCDVHAIKSTACGGVTIIACSPKHKW